VSVDWEAAVRAVRHTDECNIHGSYENCLDCGPCDCTRDARIGRGIAAVRESDELQWTGSNWIERKDAAAARAFEEGSR
jgi:hypothetical protein